MTTITREQQKQILIDTANHVISRDNTSPYSENLRELARIALAALTAEPVRYLNKFSGTCVTLEQQPNAADDVAVYMPLYTAPPVPVQVDIEMLASALKNAPLAPSDNHGRPRAPVVPEDLRRSFEAVARLNNEMYRWTSCMSYNGSYVGEPEGLLKRNIREIEHIMDSCRAAMLQGVEQPQNARQNIPENIPDGNSPAIPDDWVMVPKEPTQAMINAWLSEVANWRGHVAGYKAALAAAPQHEVK
ncbi:hypothetical protein LEI77_13210 [Salmonella enterica]|uniref:hypothetical protein n=1 Tax=Salmonella enterica TaxID=28901 RepID=UPI00098ED337|nr:hypothetical protein [Salmonella enterica]EBW8251768.1 hypothetical protein [Salmonella enterica subsp. enterica serovar Typhimurium]EDR0348578.1 hypothetical protein [Salmonella enterica subsp. enterica serovar Kedougou]EDR5998593.1 hypothetical protein [Salmonella enterica subsp. enterica serovar Kedougou]EDR6274917.1 hypothetical protein [Salmonella enterica subsp. enterica serovar Kedougou]EDW8052845.1 hypothetical protein [Salmonella enterica subsp. enterica serovar Kedougou]